MDNVVADEIARINPVDVMSEFEGDVRYDVLKWLWNNPQQESMTSPHTGLLDWKKAAKLFWNERLN